MNTHDGLLLLRMVAIALCSISIGMGLILLWIYVRHRRRSELKAHILCVATSFILVQFAEVGHMVDSLLHGLPFAWYASPLLLASATFGIVGLYRLMRVLTIKVRGRGVIQEVVTASQEVVDVAGKAVTAAEHVLTKAEEAVDAENGNKP